MIFLTHNATISESKSIKIEHRKWNKIIEGKWRLIRFKQGLWNSSSNYMNWWYNLGIPSSDVEWYKVWSVNPSEINSWLALFSSYSSLQLQIKFHWVHMTHLAASDWMKVKEASHWLTHFCGMVKLFLLCQPCLLGSFQTIFRWNEQLIK